MRAVAESEVEDAELARIASHANGIGPLFPSRKPSLGQQEPIASCKSNGPSPRSNDSLVQFEKNRPKDR